MADPVWIAVVPKSDREVWRITFSDFGFGPAVEVWVCERAAGRKAVRFVAAPFDRA